VKLFWDIYREREEIHPLVLFTDVAKILHKHDCTLQKVSKQILLKQRLGKSSMSSLLGHNYRA
jgi:hypothetical protein